MEDIKHSTIDNDATGEGFYKVKPNPWMTENRFALLYDQVADGDAFLTPESDVIIAKMRDEGLADYDECSRMMVQSLKHEIYYLLSSIADRYQREVLPFLPERPGQTADQRFIEEMKSATGDAAEHVVESFEKALESGKDVCGPNFVIAVLRAHVSELREHLGRFDKVQSPLQPATQLEQAEMFADKQAKQAWMDLEAIEDCPNQAVTSQPTLSRNWEEFE